MLRTPKNGVLATGKRELEAHLRGEKLTYRQQVLAMCYWCTNGYSDGRVDCCITDCPNYSSMPYKGKK